MSWASFFIGAGIGAGSFFSTRFIVRKMLTGGKSSKVLAGSLAFCKMFILLGLLWFLIVKISIDPLAFLLGLSCIVASLLGCGLFASRRS